ncbi:MAG: hypothetical protein JRN15_22835, partial [Nitrososphaerota archaeon]|nr:hypothetical protein [Nitrososphaerota archaeon]
SRCRARSAWQRARAEPPPTPYRIPIQIKIQLHHCRGGHSSLGAGYASFDSGEKDTPYKIMAFVKNDSVVQRLKESLSGVLGTPIDSSILIEWSEAESKFGVWTASFANSGKDEQLEKRIDEINASLLSNRNIDGRIFSYGKHVTVYKEVGYPMDVARLYGLDSDVKKADMWIAHTRQPTNSPGSSPIWSHPFSSLDCAIVHNGDISSFGANVELLNAWGYRSHVGTDSEVIARLLFYLIRIEGLSVREAATVLVNPFEDNAPRSLQNLLSRYRGAKLDGPFAVVAGYSDDEDSYLIALTDRSKFRPILIGEDENCFYVASEENQIRNISKNAEIWTPEPGSYFIASLKKGLIEPGTHRDVATMGSWNETKQVASEEKPDCELDATAKEFSEINEFISNSFRDGKRSVRITNVAGQRYIGIGLATKSSQRFKIELVGFPGNCLANLNDGADIEVFGNVGDDLGDTMHSGSVIVHGSARDVVGQALQGGHIFVRGSVGNRAAIQMREYLDHRPSLLIGESADDYLGEYMAGGTVAVLNLSGEKRPVGRFVGTGMVGGTIYVRGRVDESQLGLPPKKSDILNYLKADALDGVISDEVFEKIVGLDFPTEARLLELLPVQVFKRLRGLFFRSKYMKPMSSEYRKVNAEELSDLKSKLEEFFGAFKLPQEELDDVLNSDFTIIRTTEEEKETPLPPQEVPVEE